jgi:hypothetical protein
MKFFVPTIALLLGALIVAITLVACQRASGPAAGKATLIVQVVAEPKDGAGQPSAIDAYGNPSDSSMGSGKYEFVDYNAVGDIVVYLQPIDAAAAPAPPPITFPLDLKKPADGILGVVSVGQSVTIQNAAAKSANFYSASDGNDFDLGALAPGTTATYTVKSPGVIEVWTDVLQNPIAVLYAAPSPLVRTAGSGQLLEFDNIPPGQYKLVSWHPRLPGHESTLTLPADQTTKATVKVTVNGLPTVPSR